MKLLIIFLLLALLLILNSRLKRIEQFIGKFLKRKSYLLPDEIIVDLRRISGDKNDLVQKLINLGFERIRSFELASKVHLVLLRNKNSNAKSFIDLLTNGEETDLVLAKKKVQQQGGEFSDVTYASMVLFPDQRIQLPPKNQWFKTCLDRQRRDIDTKVSDEVDQTNSNYKSGPAKRTKTGSTPEKSPSPRRYCLHLYQTRFGEKSDVQITFSQGSDAVIRMGLIDSKATFGAFPAFELPHAPGDPYTDYLSNPTNDFDGLNYNSPEAHGTFMASVIASHYEASATLKIQSYAFHDGVSGHLMDLLAAGYSAISEGAQILNLSLGFFEESQNPHLMRLFEYAGEQNVLVICSAGNYNSNNDEVEFWPANFSYLDHVIAVAATDAHGNKWVVDAETGTNYGPISVNLAVNGAEILGYVSDTNLATLSGTSCSAAVLSARAAMVMSAQPVLSAPEIKQELISQINSGSGIFHA